MDEKDKPDTLAEGDLDPVSGGGVFGTPAGGWGADGLVMGKGPIPNILEEEGEPVIRHLDLTTKDHG